MDIQITFPQGLSDRKAIVYTFENLFRPFSCRLSFKADGTDPEAVSLAIKAQRQPTPVPLKLHELRQAFSRISGRMELNMPKDGLGRVDENRLMADYSRPDLSEWSWKIFKALVPDSNDPVFKHPQLRVHLTHDVDRVNPYDPMGLLRRLIVSTRGVDTNSLARLADFMGWVKNGVNFPEVFETIMGMEQSAGAMGTYFCMSGPYSFRKIGSRTEDCRKNRRAQKVFQQISRHGHRLGLHGCAYSLDNRDYARQREDLAETARLEVTWHRNHYLVWNPTISPPALREAGISVDSTLGFNTRQAFRAGLAWPYELWDIKKDAPSGVLEIPMVFMDAAGVITQDGLTWDDLYHQLDLSEAVGGEVAVNFHPDYFLGHPLVFKRYEAFLQWLNHRGVQLNHEVLCV